jgi:hypothetical protein
MNSGARGAMTENDKISKSNSIVDLLAMPGMEDIEFDPPRLEDDSFWHRIESLFDDEADQEPQTPLR